MHLQLRLSTQRLKTTNLIQVVHLQCVYPKSISSSSPSIMCNFVTWNVRGLGHPVKRQKRVVITPVSISRFTPTSPSLCWSCSSETVVQPWDTFPSEEQLQMEFNIKYTWDGSPVRHEPVTLTLKSMKEGLLMEVKAPFFGDPPAPPGEPGQAFPGLWDYEVVEAFFLCDESKQYLEVEICPHGQHLVLLLSGRRNAWKQELALECDVTRKGTRWEGRAVIPWSYFPPDVDRFNAYAIHGSGELRTYEALYPVPQSEIAAGQQPDFHRLEHFKPFSFGAVTGEAWKQPESDLWLTSVSHK